MLLARRQNGNLSRSEFASVSMMSWFHLTLEYDSPIVRSLRADSSSEDQRLFKIAERVGRKAHGKAFDFFRMADPLSRVLLQIEAGTYNNPAAVVALYQPGPVSEDIREIIRAYVSATNTDVTVPRGKNLTAVNSAAPAALPQ